MDFDFLVTKKKSAEKNEGNRPEVISTNADLTGVSSGGITSNPGALPTNWQLMQGYLIGPGANLSGITFLGDRTLGTTVDSRGVRNCPKCI